MRSKEDARHSQPADFFLYLYFCNHHDHGETWEEVIDRHFFEENQKHLRTHGGRFDFLELRRFVGSCLPSGHFRGPKCFHVRNSVLVKGHRAGGSQRPVNGCESRPTEGPRRPITVNG